MNLCVKCTNFSDLETILLDIRMSEALGNGRAARIILDDGNYSDVIELSRCRPQGDSPSPRQLNMCQQICIFKIELDPEIKTVY